MSVLCGGVEAGGTKFVCAVGSSPDNLHEEIRFHTTNPSDTIKRVVTFFQEQNTKEPLKAIGIGSFGPVDLKRDSTTYGHITSTPKPGWAFTDIVGTLKRALDVPIGFDTDVNAAALGEYRWGAAQGLENFIYLTVGTGIGGGAMINGQLLHGLIHPEMGHIRIPHDPKIDRFAGVCNFHNDCLEGLASGRALEKRWEQKTESLPPDHPAWELESCYLSLAVVNLICTLSPQRIVMGGGVMEQPQLFPLVRKKVQKLLNDYIQAPEIINEIDDYIVPPGLGNKAGILGAIALGQKEVI